MTTLQNTLAKQFKDLHIPSRPIILANVYDGASAKLVASLPQSKAIATASYAVAEAAGTTDDKLSSEDLLRASRNIAKSIEGLNKPLTVDVRDGYGEKLASIVKELIEIGVVGVNLEDFDNQTKTMYSQEQAVNRIKEVLDTAKSLGVPDFVINARCDVVLKGGQLDEVIKRGQAYLAAGATTVFVFGGPIRGGITREEVVKLVEAFEGRLSVSKSKDGLSPSTLAAIGVARISVGPRLQIAALEKMKEVAEELFDS
ncbi:hypothetical protein N7450_003829 [Penicillium hetheringtonii]|jgi:2-methylisocitrate lyase-like PEP mutase family enzyme|uniref:Uncharacterized protein n=1 Tax=Penicillium hetheringtonii TaxID=911720 RepID=A0AAD6DQ80_9EURO|nr:hypothetical protein N7450_003829 [Penicillium hetheringtonii]